MFRENNSIKVFKRNTVIFLVFVLLCLLPLSDKAMAEGDNYTTRLYPKGKVYQLHKKESGYKYNESNLLTSDEMLPFGRKYAGDFYLTGDSIQAKTRNNAEGYATSGKITFNYSYDGSLSDRDKKEWQLYDDDQKKVKGYSLGRKIEKGTIIIEKSYDNVEWKSEDDYCNFFDKHKDGMTGIYETKAEDVMRGTYYRVTVAYTVRKCTSSKKYDPTGLLDDYDYEECIEVYSFYVGTGKSSLHVHDVFTGTDITNTSNINVKNGFSVRKDETFSTIYVKEPGGSERSVPDYSVFTNPGEYAIRLNTAFGDDYNYTVKVTEGTDMQKLIPTVYETDSSYKSPLVSYSTISSRNITSLYVKQENGHTIKKAEYNGKQAISVDGEGVALYLQLNYGKTLDNGWMLSDDSYGGKDGQTLYGATIGRIESGALIVQTSRDGENWEAIDKGRYNEGLYTTDFQNQYGSGRRIQIYAPNGTEVLYGVYVRVVYAFEVSKNDESKNLIEEYVFYLSNSNTDAVTFHNKSVEGEFQTLFSDEEQITIDIYKTAESLTDHTQTLTGFSIDVSQNPTVKYEVCRNGQLMSANTTNFEESGKYDISLTAVGEAKQLTIFVDRDNSEESMKRYFGEGFLQGKRVYAETGYPVYVAGQTTYNILKVEGTVLPVSGKICNLSTGSEINIASSRLGKTGEITEAGEYEAKFYTNKTFTTENPVGDTRVFTFRFIVIDEKDVPGPVVNERSLKEYSTTNISDLCPRYFGITYQSAGKGYITLVFATQEEAFNYAYEHEKGEVEQLLDGTYRYKGSYQIEQKEKYESTWELTDAITYFAKQSVKEYFFDMSDEFSYITLSQEVLDNEDNLRKLELSSSVIVFAPGQKDKMLATEGLPIISPKKYAYLEPGLNSPVKRDDPHDFEFVEDNKHYDSETVVIRDKNNVSYPIEYRKGVGAQLQKTECASGIVNVLELNKYKDKNEYEAVFLREGDNLAAVTFFSYVGDKETEITVDQNSATRQFQVEAFRPLRVNDDTDRYSYVKISHNGKTECMLSESMGEKVFSEPGDYTVRCINRLGYSFDFTITIQEDSRFTVIRCVDDKGEVKEVYTSKGSRDVRLPEFVRTGYNLIGYFDAAGNHYQMVISEVSFSGSISLEAEWEAKDCQVVLVDQNGKRVLSIPVKYHEQVDIKEYCDRNGFITSNWSTGGNPIENGLLVVNSEGEIIVVAVVETKASSRSWIYYVLGGLVLIGAAGAFAVIKVKGKKEDKEKFQTQEETEDNKPEEGEEKHEEDDETSK